MRCWARLYPEDTRQLIMHGMETLMKTSFNILEKKSGTGVAVLLEARESEVKDKQ
jgi:hypothetical protein